MTLLQKWKESQFKSNDQLSAFICHYL